MAQRDGAAAVVDLLHIGAGLLLPGEHHRSERFVDLEEVDVFELEAGLAQDFLGRRDRAGQHARRLGADDGLRHDPRPWPQPEGFRLLGRHHQHGGRPIADLARVAGRHDTVLLEGGFELRHLFVRRWNTDAFVGLEPRAGAVALDVDGQDLALEPAFLDRLPGFDVALISKLVELFS